jgi:glucose-6-phosphate isomerase
LAHDDRSLVADNFDLEGTRMSDRPVTFDVDLTLRTPDWFDHHTIRRLSDLQGIFSDQDAYVTALSEADCIVYEVYAQNRPPVEGELLYGLSILHPGKIGDEFHMTKGHFHTKLATAEIYYCLVGKGRMIMETPEGDWSVEELLPHRVLYVPPRWAHRSVNTSTDQDLLTFFVYPADAGHDYATIEKRGFQKRVIARGGEPLIVDNPDWTPAEDR